jgi:hypothetical protein
MARPKGQPKLGGRQKGTPNKRTLDIKGIAQKHGPEALDTLIDVMRNGSDKDRVTAADKILDRAYGKAPQAHTGEGGEGPVRMEVIWTVVRPKD